MSSLYLLINIASVLAPIAFSFHPKLQFYRNWKAFFTGNLIVAGVFIAWDILFTSKGVWGFNPRYVLGINLFNLPIEEILFFICIPFACVFTYHCLTKFFNIVWSNIVEIICTIICSAFLLTVGLLNYDKLYTSSTCISTAILLLLLKFIFKIDWLGKFISVYIVLLLPFFIVNGILTGTGPDEAVVWYNNNENLGIRILTIPIEDFAYGFELLLLNVFLYKHFLSMPNNKQ